jgi:hypothetical protein
LELYAEGHRVTTFLKLNQIITIELDCALFSKFIIIENAYDKQLSFISIQI